MFENSAAGLDADRFARGFNRHHDSDEFVLGDFVEIHMKNFTAQRVMLNFLNKRETLLLVHVQVHKDILGERVVDEVGQLAPDQLKIFRLGLASVDRGRDAT